MIKQGWIYCLPSETLKVIVKYHPKWMISVVIPSTTKKIKAIKRLYEDDDLDSRDLEIKVPNLVISHSLRRPWVPNSKIETYFTINVIDLKNQSEISVQPYRLSNVYSNGNICFGDIGLDRKPSNLRQANNYFWSSSFNEDNCPYLDKHYQECSDREHDHYDEQRLREVYESTSYLSSLGVKGVEERIQENCTCCINECGCTCFCDKTTLYFDWINNYYNQIKQEKFVLSTKFFCGERYFASDTPSSNIFISNVEELLKAIPEKCHRKDGLDSKMVIGLAKLANNKWEIDLGSYNFQLTPEQIEVI